jgi:hypothetical protein
MPPLTREQYEPLFATIPIYQSSSVVRLFVADINGHPRTLMAVIDILLDSNLGDPTRPRLLQKLLRGGYPKGFDFKVPAEVIIKALLQQKVNLETETSPGQLSYAYGAACIVSIVCMSR